MLSRALPDRPNGLCAQLGRSSASASSIALSKSIRPLSATPSALHQRRARILNCPLDPTIVSAYNLTMNLKQANPYLKSASARAKALWISAQTSSAVEGIHRPFAGGVKAWKPSSLQAFIAHWKRLASKSVR